MLSLQFLPVTLFFSPFTPAMPNSLLSHLNLLFYLRFRLSVLKLHSWTHFVLNILYVKLILQSKTATAAILYHSCTPEHSSEFWLLSFQVLNALSCTRDISLFSACCFPLFCHHSSLQLLLDVRKKVKTAYFFLSPWAPLPPYFSFLLPHKFPFYRPSGRTDSLCALLLLKQDFCQRSHFLLVSFSVPSVASSRQGAAHVRRSLSTQGWHVACLELYIYRYIYMHTNTHIHIFICISTVFQVSH